MSTGVNLLFGAPNETLESVAETARLARELADLGASIMVTVGLRVYPGTPLERLSMLPRYARYLYRAKGGTLSRFCSPLPPRQLHDVIARLLPPSENVIYTSTPIACSDEYYSRLAWANHELCTGNVDKALEGFLALTSQGSDHPEATLGILKAQAASGV